MGLLSWLGGLLRPPTEAEERFRLIVDSMRDYAIFMMDPSGLVATWNLGAERITGYRRSEIVGRHFSAFYPPYLADTDWPSEVLAMAASGGRYEEENWRVRKDGTQFWASVVINRVTDAAGRLTGFVKVTRDLTERKKAEDEAKKLNELLRLRLEALEGFNNSVCHDLNAPLRAMEGFAEAVVQDFQGVDPTLTDYLHRIRSACRRMRLLVNDLVRLSRMNRDGVTPKHETFSMTELTEELLGLERTHPENSRHEVRVQRGMAACGDRDLAYLLVQNLLANAFKFSQGKDRPLVRVGEAGGEFFVSDNGVGFDQSQVGRLFKPFSRLHDASEFDGTGIGLTIAKRVADLHDGYVRAEGRPGGGATFFFALAPESRCHANH